MTTTSRRAARLAGDDGGFTVVEVVVAFLLFAIVGTAAIAAVVNATKTSHMTQQRIQAADLAQQDIAQSVAAYEAGTLPSSTTYTATSGSESFTVTRTVAFVGSATACSSGNAFTVHVQVTPKTGGGTGAKSDTEIAC